MNTYVINLDQDHVRWKRIHQDLVREGIAHTRFKAIDGKTMGNRYDFLLVPGTRWWTPRGVLGCVLSHYLCLQQFLLYDPFPYCLILEDDVRMVPGVKKRIAALLDAAPPDADVVKFKFWPYNEDNGRGRGRQRSPRPVFSRNRFTVENCAYVITKEGASKVLSHKICWPGHADVLPCLVRSLRVYTVSPQWKTFWQRSENSHTSVRGRYPCEWLDWKVLRLGPTNVELVLGDFLISVFVLVALLVFWFG